MVDGSEQTNKTVYLVNDREEHQVKIILALSGIKDDQSLKPSVLTGV
jgi:hypothetical protein